MSLTKEQLLIPRYLCTGTEEGTPNYPGSKQRTGEILTFLFIDSDGSRYDWGKNLLYEKEVKKFPNCFKPLPWWYGRKVEEMPTHVRSKETGRIYKRYEQPSYEGFDPATFEEYQKQKEG